MIATAMDDTEPVCPRCGSDSYREKVVGHTDRRRCTSPRCCTAFDAPLPERLKASRPGRKPRRP